MVEEGTRVDLGEDLVATPSVPAPVSRPRPTPRDDLDSARILINEGLLEDARRALFSVLRSEPGNRLALGLLEQIRATEIQAILKPDGRAQVAHPRSQSNDPALRQNPEELIAKLDDDWNLGLAPSDAEIILARRWVTESLEPSSSMQERMDWAVALIQLGMPEVAVEVLESAPESLGTHESLALHARTNLDCGRFEEARALAESGLKDADLPKDLREEMSYIRAVSLMRTGRLADAASIFASLGSYRDSRPQLEALSAQSRKKT